MAKTCNSTILDEALNYIKNNGGSLCVCNAQPTTYAQAITTYMLAKKTGLTSADFTGPAAGDVSGRKITVNQQTGISVTNSGTAIYVALVDDAGAGALLLVTTCTSQALTSGNTVTVPAWKMEIADPT